MGNIHVEYKQTSSIIPVSPWFLRMLLQSELHTPVSQRFVEVGCILNPRSNWTHDAVLRPIPTFPFRTVAPSITLFSLSLTHTYSLSPPPPPPFPSLSLSPVNWLMTRPAKPHCTGDTYCSHRIHTGMELVFTNRPAKRRKSTAMSGPRDSAVCGLGAAAPICGVASEAPTT